LHALDRADAHVDRGAHLQQRKGLLDHARHERRGGRDAGQLELFQEHADQGAGALGELVRDGLLAIASGVDEQHQVDAHLCQRAQLLFHDGLCVGIDALLDHAHGRTPAGLADPGEIDFPHMLRLVARDLDDRIILIRQLITDAILHGFLL
jgi:hypothetical protein